MGSRRHIRDFPLASGFAIHLEDAALILIDYQKEMFDTVRSEAPAELIDLNVRLLIKAAKAFNMPIVLSTVGVEMGVNHPTRQSILDELPGISARYCALRIWSN